MAHHRPIQTELFPSMNEVEETGIEEIAVPKTLWERLSHSQFRRQFHLNARDRLYLERRGFERIMEDGRNFIQKRLAPAHPKKDGRQTPWRGHPIFVAQHATGNCCRSCLYKWHKIAKGHELSRREQHYVLNVLRQWLEREETHTP